MSNSRRPTAAWSRLRTVTVDPLDSVGLVSKGDEQLKDLKKQEAYFSTIIGRYMRFCATTGKEFDLNAAFQALPLSENGASSNSQSPEKSSAHHDKDTDSNAELGTLMMAMRKLREALIASNRADSFAQRSLMFITRATILTSIYEAYYPSLLRLLNFCHVHCPLSPSDLREFVGYHILDLACRQGAYTEALIAKHQWGLKDERVESVLIALIRNDWVRYWRASLTLDGYQRCILKFAEDDMRKHALKCLGRSYFSVEKTFVEKSAGRGWEDLKELDKVGWELEGEKVVIRRIRHST